MSLFGTRVLRVEDDRMLAGQGTFVGNLKLDHQAFATFVRSTDAHARIMSIDTSVAAAMPGVLAAFTAAELDLPDQPPPFPGLAPQMVRPVLARDRVRFVGEPVAVIVAESAAAGADAAEAVVVEYEPLTPVIGVDASRDATASNGTLLHPEAGTNLAFEIASDDAIDFSTCAVKIDAVIENQRLAPAPIEGRVAAATWVDDRLVHHASSQGSHRVLEMLVELYGLEPDAVRVITPDVGGGFGAKASPSPEELIIGELSRRVQRPVMWSETRTENMIAMTHGRAQRHRIRMGGTRDGRITHYRLDIDQDGGAYPVIGSLIPMFTRFMACGVYDIEHVEVTARSWMTSTTPVGAYRGAGRPEAAAALERAVDLFARAAGLDPVDVRRANLVADDAFPHTTPTGVTYDSGAYDTVLSLALEAADHRSLRAEQAARRAAGDPIELGVGVSVYVEITAGAGGGEYGQIELRPDGGAIVRTGSTPYGQGHDTSWAMLASDRTGIPLDRIEVRHGDTDEIPTSGITGGSRSLQIAGAAVDQAAKRLVDIARERAAARLEAAVDDVVLDTARGAFHVAGTPARALTWAEVADDAGGDPLCALADVDQDGGTFPFGAHVAVVEVDTETGAVTLRSLTACDDAGVILNPMLAEGQIHGGLAQGAAQALLEAVAYDEHGTPLSTNLADYPVISAAELPFFDRVESQTPSPLNDLGAKGIGESGTIGSTPAVHNAVIDALSTFGVDHIDMPCTPQRVWMAIQRSPKI